MATLAVTAVRGIGANVPPELGRALETSRYVYSATARKAGGFGTPAEIWFMYDRGAVWVASPPTTWRVKRIRAPEGWPQYESRFREWLQDGGRVLIRHGPVTPQPSVSPGCGSPRPSPTR